MREAVLFDLDSTLADTLHRQWMVPLIKAKQMTWEEYSLACENDSPIEGTIALAQLLKANGFRIYIVTDRSDAAQELTAQWLLDHGVAYDRLIMRKANSRMHNGEFKVGVIQLLRREGSVNPVLFVEDYPKAAEYIREQTDIPVLLVAERYAPGVPGPDGVKGGV